MNIYEPPEHDSTTLVKNVGYDGLIFDVTLKDQFTGHAIITQGSRRRAQGVSEYR